MTDKAYTIEELKELSGVFAKNDPSPANALGVRVPHGLQADGAPFAGLFSTPGGEPGVFSTLIRFPSLAALLLAPAPSVITNPQFDIVTGVTATRGTTGAGSMCGPAAQPGLTKIATHTSQFGLMRLDTDTGQATTLGGRVNRADMDKQFYNLQVTNNPFLPDVLRNATDLNDFTAMQLFNMGVAIERALMRVLFTGNASLAPGATEAEFEQEFDGFDRLIKTGYQDAISGTLTPAVDSIVEDWSADIGASVLRNGATYSVVQVLTEMWYVLNTRASDMGLNPTQWALVMHPDLFRALTRIWACSYLTSGCNTSIDGQPEIDSASQRMMQDEMFTGRFLWMDGERVPVVLARGMDNDVVGNGFESSIYFIPMSSMGMRTTYLEFFDQGNAQALAWANGLMPGGSDYTVSNGGLYAWSKSYQAFCFQYHLAAQPRLIMRTPFLAARLDNVRYSNFIYTSDPYPTGIYHRNGGVTQRTAWTTLIG